jgi:hypothetical protein
MGTLKRAWMRLERSSCRNIAAAFSWAADGFKAPTDAFDQTVTVSTNTKHIQAHVLYVELVGMDAQQDELLGRLA